MATSKRPSQSKKRTPKVAGRASARVELSDSAAAKRAAAGVTTPVSGVDRKRLKVDQERAREDARRAVAEAEPTPSDTAGTYRSAAIIGAIAVVIGAIAAVLAFHPGAEVTDNKAFVDQGETDRVLSATRDAACAPFQYDYRSLDKWIANAESKLTDGALGQMQKFLKTSRQIITQTQAASDCRVDVVGVKSLTKDEAVVLTDMLVSTSKAGALEQSSMPHVQFTLVRQSSDGDDHWKISDIHAF